MSKFLVKNKNYNRTEMYWKCNYAIGLKYNHIINKIQHNENLHCGNHLWNKIDCVLILEDYKKRWDTSTFKFKCALFKHKLKCSRKCSIAQLFIFNEPPCIFLCFWKLVMYGLLWIIPGEILKLIIYHALHTVIF